MGIAFGVSTVSCVVLYLIISRIFKLSSRIRHSRLVNEFKKAVKNRETPQSDKDALVYGLTGFILVLLLVLGSNAPMHL